MAPRTWRGLVAVASWLSRRGVSPNGISLAGMAAGLAAGALLAATSSGRDESRFLWLGAALLVGVRGLANLLDGMVAIGSGRASPLGELFNEVPDRVSDAAMLIGLGYARGGSPWLGFAAALAAVFTAYVRAMAKVAGAPQDYRGPMAKPHRMAVVAVACVLGFVAPERMGERFNAAAPTPADLSLWVVIAGCGVTVARRLHRAAKHLREARR